jgi:origin recognition complex subunit 3
VRIRSAEASNLKAALKKIIREATSHAEDADRGELTVARDVSCRDRIPALWRLTSSKGRKYLDYDLEALYAEMGSGGRRRVVLAFEDGEGFDSALLCDLISLLSSWRDRIQFTIVFGIATSVDLFQARLLKLTCQQLHGGQFDIVQTSAVLDTIIEKVVSRTECGMRVGSTLLRSMIERQKEQVAGIQSFVSSLKVSMASCSPSPSSSSDIGPSMPTCVTITRILSACSPNLWMTRV